jgi:hypothetical protein
MTPEDGREERRRGRIVTYAVPQRRRFAHPGEPHHTPGTPGGHEEEPVKLDKQELVRMLRTEGDNDTADRVEGGRLPQEIDTDRDGDALAEVGLDRTELMNKLAGGSFGTTLSP